MTGAGTKTPALTPMKVPRLSPVRQQKICKDNGTKGKAPAVKHGQNEAVPLNTDAKQPGEELEQRA